MQSSHKGNLRKTKTDKLDAHLISKMLLTYDYKTYSLKSYHILALKSLTRLRFSMVKERTKYKVRLKNIMDLIFPEFFSFFSDSYGPTPMYLLSKYKSPNNISNVEIKVLYEDIFKVSSGRYSYVKLLKLQDCAKKSIGKSNDILEFQLQSILNMIVFYNNEINKFEIVSVLSMKCDGVRQVGYMNESEKDFVKNLLNQIIRC